MMLIMMETMTDIDNVDVNGAIDIDDVYDDDDYDADIDGDDDVDDDDVDTYCDAYYHY